MPSLLMTEENRARMQGAIEEIFPRGMTNLSDGWLMGCEAVGKHQRPESINRVLLLSDGLANQGITSIAELGQHAAALHERGVSTSTFGVGTDFNEELMERMSNQGGGNFYFIEHPNQITEIFLQELTELVEVSAKQVTLSCALPAGVSVEVLGGWRHEVKHETIEIFLGDMIARQERALYLIASLPPAAEQTGISLTLAAQGEDENNAAIQKEYTIQFSYDSLLACEQAPFEKEMMERYGRVYLSETTREAIKLERMGRRQEAQQLMNQSIKDTSSFLSKADMPVFERRSNRLAEGLTVEERKRMHYRSYQRSRNRIDDVDESSAED